MKKVKHLLTKVRAPSDPRYPTPLDMLPQIMLEAHKLLVEMPSSYGEDGEFRLIKASLNGRDVDLVFELGAPGSHLDAA